MPRPRLHTILVAVLVWGVRGDLATAQRADALAQGARVRVDVAPAGRDRARTVDGTVARADSAAITVLAGGEPPPESIPWGRVRRVEAFAGRRTGGAAFGHGALRGAVVGAAVGAGIDAAGYLLSGSRQCDEGNTVRRCSWLDAGTSAAIVVSGTFWGSVVGGLVGLSHRDRWTPVWRPR